MKEYLSMLRRGILPSRDIVKIICRKASEIFIDEPNVVQLTPPITLCGDIHGQFHDLLELFQIGDTCPNANYCFMGDYVDRGHHSIESLLYLLILKILYPQCITLLRGNHETRSITKAYTFYDECLNKFGYSGVYECFSDLFDYLPISAVIGSTYFVVHGGISPKISDVSAINFVNRFQEIECDTVIGDLVWSDPEEDQEEEWIPSTRGAGYTFNSQATQKFNNINNFDCIFRSHQMGFYGYHYIFNDLCTVWSAPNYKYCEQNVGSILEINEHFNREFKIFFPNPLSHKKNKFFNNDDKIMVSCWESDDVLEFPTQHHNHQQLLRYFL